MTNRCCLVVLSWVLVGLAGCGGIAPSPIEIGHIADKTRIDKAGEQAEQGLRLALSELSKDDALANEFAGRKPQIRHTYTQGKPDEFESQAVRLESVSRCVALFGGMSTAETAALSNAKAPILSFHGQPTSGAGNHVFYLGLSPGQQGAALAKVIAEDAKALAVLVLIDERRPESASLAESFQKTLDESRKKAGAEPATVLALRFGKDAKWSEIDERMKVQKPGVVVFAGTAADFNAWHKTPRKESKESEPLVVFAGNDGAQRLFDLEGDAKASIMLATAFYADPASEKIKAFAKSFREEWKTDPDVHAALAYDGLHILVEAMKATRTQLTPERLRDELLKIKNFEGLTGPLTINADRQVERPVRVLRWQNGAVTSIKTIAP